MLRVGGFFLALVVLFPSAARARWLTVDPAREFHSPYVYGGNNPIKYTDPTGRTTYTTLEGNVIHVVDDGGNEVYQFVGVAGGLLPMPVLVERGRTMRWDSFIWQEAYRRWGQVVPKGKIEFESTWARDTVMGLYNEVDSFWFDYVMNARGGHKYDVKRTLAPEGNIYYGSQFLTGTPLDLPTYVSARDAGNLLAGMVAQKAGVEYGLVMSGYGAYQQAGTLGGLQLLLENNWDLSHLRHYGEDEWSHFFQDLGYWYSKELQEELRVD